MKGYQSEKGLANSSGFALTPYLPGVILFLLALAIRVIFLFESADAPTFETPVVDAWAYHQAAVSLVNGDGFRSTFFFQPFLYPAFLSGIYWLFGPSIVTAKVLQALLGAFTCVLVWRLGRKLFGEIAGLLAGLITAFYLPLIFYEAELLGTGLAAFASVALVLLFLQARERPSSLFLFLLGMFCAVCVLIRPTFLPVVIGGTIWLMVAKPKPVGALIALLVLGFLIPTYGVGRISKAQTGHFSFLPSSGGLNFYLGNNENFEETVNARPGSEWSDLLYLAEQAGVTDDPQSRQRFYWNSAWEYAAAEPVAFASGMGTKALQFVSSRETPRNVDLYLFREWSVLLKALLWKAGSFGFPFGLLFPLAMAGWLLQRKRIPRVLLLTLGLYSLSVIAVFVTARYRLPMIPLLAVLAAGGITGIRQAINEKRTRRLLWAAGVLVGSLLICVLPGPFIAEKIDYEAELYGCLGDSLRRSGDLAAATERFEQAIKINPDYAEAHADLAQLYAVQGKLEEAIDSSRTALSLKPGLVRAISNLSSLLSDQGRHEEAIQYCRRGLQLRPGDAGLHFNLAKALAGQGAVKEAGEALDQALTADPEHTAALFERARIYEREGNPEEAIRLLERAAAITPDAETCAALGMLYLRTARAAEAETYLEETLRLAPGYPRIGFELGSLLLRNGRFREAVAPLQDAVRSDPRAPVPRHTLAVALAGAGRPREAIEQYRQVLQLAKDYVPSLAGLAWLQATHPQTAIRNGEEAVRLAERAQAQEPANPNVLSTLSAAYAEVGRFSAAEETAERAAARAELLRQFGLAQAIRARLELFKSGQAYRDPSYK